MGKGTGEKLCQSKGGKLCNNVWYVLLLSFTCLYKNNSLSHTMSLNYGVGFLWDPWFTMMLWWKLTTEPNHINSNTTTGQFSISCPCLGCQMSEEYLCLDQYPDCSFHFTWQRPFLWISFPASETTDYHFTNIIINFHETWHAIINNSVGDDHVWITNSAVIFLSFVLIILIKAQYKRIYYFYHWKRNNITSWKYYS